MKLKALQVVALAPQFASHMFALVKSERKSASHNHENASLAVFSVLRHFQRGQLTLSIHEI